MKFFTIGSVSALFCILGPVTAMSNKSKQQPLPVPKPNQEFTMSCQNGNSYEKSQLVLAVQTAKQVMGPNNTHNGYPFRLNWPPYEIPGQLWYYPVAEGQGIQDFVVFNTNDQIAGVVTRHVFNGQEIFRPCEII